MTAAKPLATRRQALAQLAGLTVAVPALAADDDAKTYSEDEMLKKASAFFGRAVEGLGDVIERAFKEQGRPNAYITGEEASAAIAVGLRFGDGRLTMKKGGSAKVYWA